MNDRFKSRLWNCNQKRYIYNFMKSVINDEITYHEILEDRTFSLLSNTHITEEQCTGLKDKNGNLIYENDI